MFFCIKKKSCIKNYSDKTIIKKVIDNNIIEAEYIKPCQIIDNQFKCDNQTNITINLINEYLVRLKLLWDKKDKLLELPEIDNNIDKRNVYIIEIMNLEKCILELTKLLN